MDARFAAALTGAALGIDQSAEIVETVGGDEADSDQFPQCGFNFGLELPGAADDVREE